MPSRPCPRPTHRFCPGIHWPQAQARTQGQSPGLRFSQWSMLGIHTTAPQSSGHGHGHWFRHRLWPQAQGAKTQTMATGSGICSGTGPKHWFRPWPRAQARSQFRHWPPSSMSACMIPLSRHVRAFGPCKCPICFRPRVCYNVLPGFVGPPHPSRTALSPRTQPCLSCSSRSTTRKPAG